ncbi:aromatic-ring-hydroxylating dioxygenase [Rugosibacter aromaticivorans]|uniref:Aromatic-ring-hydroxylating dioxygenase n=2 Tax=Bacteria TaxID=2 RepID=A0A0C5J6U5_9PROT|nr:3-phenylpropionate/cinnamic acid dioxygenase subunit beta [Rugosibacter aromaticivorans]AFH77971.1 ring-hydroxylating dioxygenase small subunit [bacterium enrichment culture clone pahAd5]AJP47625.1 aromatic-ring-hydroxylating dioxygenase [Rugosibacter aromaticivorans]
MGNAELKLAPAAPVSFEQEYAIGKFLLMEARVLDEERYPEWLDLLTEDIRYQIPVPLTTYRRNRASTTALKPLFIIDDGFPGLKQRAAREATGLVWLNDPATRHLRMVNNIEVEATDTPNEFFVRSKFLLYRGRRDKDIVSHAGWREDILRQTSQGFRVARRVVHLLERVVMDKNLNMFF